MRKTLLQLLFISSLSLFIGSCEKEDERFPESEKAEKTTIVELPLAADGPLAALALDPTPGVKTINVLEIKRDPKNPAEFYKKLVIKVKYQNAMISEPSSGEIKELPRNLYTNHPDNPFDGQFWTVTFQPGEWSAYIKINLDPAALFTLTTRVGLGFVLAEATDAKISETNNQLGVEISAKNQWDGVYSYVGSLVHPTACISGPIGTPSTGGPLEISLITTGANTVKRDMFGLENFIYWDNCQLGLGYFSNVIPAYQVNANNTVTILSRPGSTVTWANGTPMTYNPSTKTFTLNYGYVSTPDRVITETMVYLRPR